MHRRVVGLSMQPCACRSGLEEEEDKEDKEEEEEEEEEKEEKKEKKKRQDGNQKKQTGSILFCLGQYKTRKQKGAVGDNSSHRSYSGRTLSQE